LKKASAALRLILAFGFRPKAICPKRGAKTMAKTTAKYETVFIVRPDVDEEGTKAIVEKFKALIAGAGTLGEVEEWGKRKLAYPINDYTEGYYALLNFESTPDLPAELDRVYKITDGIMRSLIVCKDE
jgi:small subunit ribosomal protein S6